MNTSLVLAAISGICWTIVYIESIRLGFKQKTYAMPFWALALNIAWEGVHSIMGFQLEGVSVQTLFNIAWFICDIGILYTFFKYGKKEFPKQFSERVFYMWSVVILIASVILQYLFVKQFGLVTGGAYSAFIQNLLMSVLFINMFINRNGMAGQSILLAVNKWLGTLAPTILFGYLGTNDYQPNMLVLALDIFCSLFDIVYIFMLVEAKKLAQSGF